MLGTLGLLGDLYVIQHIWKWSLVFLEVLFDLLLRYHIISILCVPVLHIIVEEDF